MPGRKFTSADYRFSVNGTEKSPEIGSGHNTTYFRELDSRTGRWWSTDPVWHPWQSNYSTFDNNPIALADPSGSTTTGGPKKGKRGENFDPCIEYHAYQAKLARKAKREAKREKAGELIKSIGEAILFSGGNDNGSGGVVEPLKEDNIRQGTPLDQLFYVTYSGEYAFTEVHNDNKYRYGEIFVYNNNVTVEIERLKFNDPSHDTGLFDRTTDHLGCMNMPILYRVTSREVADMLHDATSGEGSRFPYTYVLKESVGKKMDFGVYHLQIYLTKRIRDRFRLTNQNAGALMFKWWNPYDLGLREDKNLFNQAIGSETISPFFKFEGNNKVYNYWDTGNFLWGAAMHSFGYTLKDAVAWAKWYNKEDSSADMQAIKDGWNYAKENFETK